MTPEINSIKNLLGSSAVFTTVLQYLCGMIVCYKFYTKRSTGDSSAMTFISGFLACCLWLRYGLLQTEQMIIIVNGIGAVLMFLYTMVYYVFTVNKRLTTKQLLSATLIIFSSIIYTSYETDTEKASRLIGLFCCLVAVAFFASPLTNLRIVIKTKNSESLPFPIILSSFFVTLQWFIYGYLIDDLFIQLPNFLGCVLSAAQLLLFVAYPSKSTVQYKTISQIASF